MNTSIWGVFHDGCIKSIQGEVPGNVTVCVEIQYLRSLFDANGTSFEFHLKGCTKFKYVEFDQSPMEDLQEIVELEPEILSVATEQPLVLNCVMGTLELEYQEMYICLDSGERIEEELLIKASELYWTQWRESTKAIGEG